MDLTVRRDESMSSTYIYSEKAAWIAMLIFLIINTLKITIFDIFMTSNTSIQTYMYKFGTTLTICMIIYIMIFGIRYRFLFAAFYLLQAFYIFVNLVYYNYFHSYLHIAQAFALSSESMGAASDLSVLLCSKLFIVILDLPLAIYIIFAYPFIARNIKKIHGVKRLAIVLVGILVIGTIESLNYFNKYSLFNIAKPNDSASEALVVQRYGTIANNIADLALNKNTNSMISQLKYGQPLSGKGTNNSIKPNIVMIQVESMDSSAVNTQHGGLYIMPFLHSLSQQSIYYPYTMSYHEAGGTSDCEFSIINSMQPLGDYPAIDINNYNYPNSIVRQLANNSYSTIAFHGDVGSYYNRNTAYPKMGYQEFMDLNRMGLQEEGWGAPDGDVFNYAENTLKNIKQPFFAYTITMTSHGPFTNANNYYNNKSYDDVKDQTTKDYMNSMSYVDKSIEDYVNYIRANYKNTYIFIYGDHTPDVNSNDYKQASFTAADKYFEFVPLIIVTPDNRKYQESNIAASFLDIAPTIANASGISYNLDSDGIDLLNRSGNVNEVPFRGGIFDRTYLFGKVSNINW